jgi:hypothetical protein
MGLNPSPGIICRGFYIEDKFCRGLSHDKKSAHPSAHYFPMCVPIKLVLVVDVIIFFLPSSSSPLSITQNRHPQHAGRKQAEKERTIKNISMSYVCKPNGAHKLTGNQWTWLTNNHHPAKNGKLAKQATSKDQRYGWRMKFALHTLVDDMIWNAYGGSKIVT